MWGEFILTFGVVLVADRVTKAAATSRLSAGSFHLGAPWLSIRCTANKAGALGYRMSAGKLMILWACAFAAVLAFLALNRPGQSIFPVIGFGAATAGALGNLMDRISMGAVVDFIEIGPWPSFNLADAAIVSGLVLVAIPAL